MAKEEDYRNTAYCPILESVVEKKQALEEEIKLEAPRTKIIYNKVCDRKSKYHKKFAKIYNNKCAYCGSMWEILPVECFEVDHFINEASFTETKEGRIEAGKMKNLVWSCISCNRGKTGITIKPPYDELLNVDNGNIVDVFWRDENYYIQICDTYQKDEFIKKFYESTHLGYETRRLDFLLLQLDGKCKCEKNEKNKNILNEKFKILLKRRNRMTVTDGETE